MIFAYAITLMDVVVVGADPLEVDHIADTAERTETAVQVADTAGLVLPAVANNSAIITCIVQRVRNWGISPPPPVL